MVTEGPASTSPGSGESAPPESGVPEFRVGFTSGFLLTLALGLLIWPMVTGEEVVQPIAFNHLLHGEQGLECVDCHPGVLEAGAPGLPTNSICLDCHEEAFSDSQEELRLVELLAVDEPIQWKPLFRQPGHVYFSHRRHIVGAELECATCHGDLGQSEEPPLWPPPITTMDECMTCHLSTGVSDDCTVCHR